MKITTTLEEIIKHELINQGENEFIREDGKRFVMYDNQFQFLTRILRFDNIVYRIVTDKFFYGEGLENEERDKDFKKHFISRFYARQIGNQTMERFAGNVLNTFLNNEYFLNEYYNNLDDYINQKTNQTDDNQKQATNDNRLLESDLPQNEVNLNVEDTVLDYGNLNRIIREKQREQGNTNSESTSKDLAILIESRHLLNEVFNDFERNCFLFVW